MLIYHSQITPDTSGLGAPLSKAQIQAKEREREEEAQREAEHIARPPPPPRQYRADTTGLSTANLPPPPGRKDGADGRSPVALPPPTAAKSKTPVLPPRLPPRQNTSTPRDPPTYIPGSAQMNQGSLNRLEASGMSVPDFGIGKESASPTTNPSKNSSPGQLNELQSRFSKLSPTSPTPEGPTNGTTWAQKQAALKTASSFRTIHCPYR